MQLLILYEPGAVYVGNNSFALLTHASRNSLKYWKLAGYPKSVIHMTVDPWILPYKLLHWLWILLPIFLHCVQAHCAVGLQILKPDCKKIVHFVLQTVTIKPPGYALRLRPAFHFRRKIAGRRWDIHKTGSSLSKELQGLVATNTNIISVRPVPMLYCFGE